MRGRDAFSNAMGTSRRRRIGPGDAERLLATGRDPAYPELTLLLTVTAGPPQPSELAGLPGAVAAFEAAGRVARPTAVPRRRRVLRPLATAAAVVAMLAGGVAVAAETGNLPGDPATSPPPATGGPPNTPRATLSHRPSGAPTAPPPSGDHGRTLSPASPAVAGLCRAWEAQRRNPRGVPMTSEAMRDLVAAAGGEARIAAFCAALLPASHPPTPSHPAGKGPGRPTPSKGKKG